MTASTIPSHSQYEQFRTIADAAIFFSEDERRRPLERLITMSASGRASFRQVVMKEYTVHH